MTRSPALLLAIVLALLAGCLGNEKTFPDETDQVRALHVNAFQSTEGAAPRPALVQVSGLGGDGQERAFRGHVRVEIERALHPEADVEYVHARAYDEDVTAQSFSSTTVPYWSLTIPASDLPEDATYRASATATLPGHEPLSASALFSFGHS